MGDYFSRNIIEALRSGISSRDVGQCFSSARHNIMRTIYESLQKTSEDRVSDGMVITGKYGEGKTHLLNTVFSMATEQRMAVSIVSLSKETPVSSLPVLYQKILQNTYLPGRHSTGFADVLDSLANNPRAMSELYEFCLTGLDTNRLYYVMKAFTGTADEEEKYALLGDIEGDLLANNKIRSIYRRINGTQAVFNTLFAKSKHIGDYFSFISHLILTLGFNGWVLLFDEAELIGRLGKKTRLKAYENIMKFLKPSRMESTFSIFAFNASYIPDVIDAKKEDANLEEALLPHDTTVAISDVLRRIRLAPQLVPLDRSEIIEILAKIRKYHADAFDWEPSIEPEALYEIAEKHGYLLRTHIRAAVEMLDQQYQYGEFGSIRFNELGKLTFEEDSEGAPEE